MRRFGGKVLAASRALVLALGCAASALHAQASPDFSIPSARPTVNPRAQGPIDAENPYVRPSETPPPSPAPVPVATPIPALAPVARRTAPAAAARPDLQPRPGFTTRAVPAPLATIAAPVTPAPQTEPSPPLSASTAAATDSFDVPAANGAAPAQSSAWWPWLVAAAGLIASLAALVWRRRRTSQPVPLEFEPPVVPSPARERAPSSAPLPGRESAALPLPAVPSTPVPALPQGVGIVLEAKRMSASLIATTLSYALTVTNNSHETLSALAIEGDMIAAHASLAPEQQIASGAQALELRHALVTLEPGESAEFKGDFRLPLTSLTPIRAGNAAYFVPLARVRVAASTPTGQPMVQVQTFVVGERGETDGAGLRPFRLDLGPRTYSQLSQRAIS